MRLSAALAALVLSAGFLTAPAVAANAPAPAPAGQPAAMLAHRALYTLSLAKAKNHDVIGANGTMGYEVIDACDGWSVRQRLRMTVTNADGQNIDMTSDYATWESKDGLHFRFHMRQTTDGAVTSLTDGDATLSRTGGAGVAHYSAPREQTLKLPAGTVFPMKHTEALLAASRENRRFLNLPLFDGTDENGVEDSFIVVLDRKPPMPNRFPILARLPSTRVNLTFFDHTGESITPTYEVAMRYWENGVANDMTMDFGDFVMDAKIHELAVQPKHC